MSAETTANPGSVARRQGARLAAMKRNKAAFDALFRKFLQRAAGGRKRPEQESPKSKSADVVLAKTQPARAE